MNKTSIQQKIKNYILSSFQWNQENESVITQGSTGSIMMSLEEEILIHFGLPPSAFQYTSQMEKYGSTDGDIDKRADELYRWLKNEAITYLLSTPESDYQILRNGKAKLLHAQEVLPFLGYGVTEYNSFIYHDIYCRNRCDERQLLDAIRTEEISKVGSASTLNFPFATEYRSFVNNKYSKVLDNLDLIESESTYFETEYPIDAILKTDSFFVLNFVARNPNMCVVDIAIEYGPGFLALNIWCTLKQLSYILCHARYASHVASILLSLRHNDYFKAGYVFNEMRTRDKVIEVPMIDIEFERLDRRSDEVKLPYSFIITYLNPTMASKIKK
jgi:hypothetical protein